MKLLNGKELFELLYDDKITEEQCIEVIHPQETDHYILRQGCLNKFDEWDLLTNLLYKEYKFVIRNQKRVVNKLNEKKKNEIIADLERRLAKLKGEDNCEF